MLESYADLKFGKIHNTLEILHQQHEDLESWLRSFEEEKPGERSYPNTDRGSYSPPPRAIC